MSGACACAHRLLSELAPGGLHSCILPRGQIMILLLILVFIIIIIISKIITIVIGEIIADNYRLSFAVLLSAATVRSRVVPTAPPSRRSGSAAVAQRLLLALWF